MHISAVEEYGLRCALQLASLPDQGLISASVIAEREGISVQYASKIMHLFRKAGLVLAVRGTQGGFRLAKPAHLVALKEVFQAVKEERPGFCHQFTGLQQECVHLHGCSVRPVWHILSSYFDTVLAQLNLADLSQPESVTRLKIESFARYEADKLRDKFHHPHKEV